MENQTGEQFKCIQTDNGTKYMNIEFISFLTKSRIKHQRTVLYTPERNDVAERSNRTIVEKAHTMLFCAGLGKCFWAEMVNTAIYLKNCTPTKALKGVLLEKKNGLVKTNSLREMKQRQYLCRIAKILMQVQMKKMWNNCLRWIVKQNPDMWKQAIKEEYSSLVKNNAWVLVDLPEGRTAVQSKWVFKVTRDTDGNVSRFKGRLVAKGCSQKYGVDCSETCAPVVRSSTIRLLFVIAVQWYIEIDHMVVMTAFLNGELIEEVYMQQPNGFVINGIKSKICLLKKAIYGLKQSSKAWYGKMHTVLVAMGFDCLECEPCLYLNIMDDCTVIIAVYVEDILLRNNPDEKFKVKQKLMSKFQMKDLGRAQHVLGMRIRYSNGAIFVDQEMYIQQILKRFEMVYCKPVLTPMEVGRKLLKGKIHDDDKRTLIPISKDRNFSIFQSMDISNKNVNLVSAINDPEKNNKNAAISRFNISYGEEHSKCTKRVLRYLKGTMNLSLLYKKIDEGLTRYDDSGWGIDFDRRSYTGSCVISWDSRKQRTVALSSTEAEYMALTQGTREAIYLRNVLCRLFKKEYTLMSYSDSQSALKLAANHICRRPDQVSMRPYEGAPSVILQNCLQPAPTKQDFPLPANTLCQQGWREIRYQAY
ncbi:hypothetical protein PR048_015597 [Dryococelus australis]|uniref:Integrase catalytic domain-containing protein n=1 Tax=Dryococelus australis TaxID=614101 RepID=A0ABQ9HHE3_9NEOP|nr:hypothetical protein PR048_015597 [Dryococelus australis]